MKTLIVDDHALIRVFLKHYIEEHYPNFEVVVLRSITSDLPEQIILAKPELVILDISLNEFDTLDFFIHLKQHLPKTLFVIYTMHNIFSYKNFFLKHGAHAYVLKEDAQSELKDVIATVLNGGRVFPKLDTQKFTDYQLNQLTFSTNEKALLSALLDSLDTEIIAEKLNLTNNEVLAMRQKLLKKTGAKNTQQLVLFTINYNWIR